MSREIVSVPCRHGGKKADKCMICKGTGQVMVEVGHDGNPRPCRHRGGDIDRCATCRGSGWAGLVERE